MDQLITTDFLSAYRREKKRRTVAGVDQEQLLEPEALADPDSLFYNFNGTRIHHKICHGGDQQEQLEVSDHKAVRSSSGTERMGLSMILLHGFGASVFSWGEVMKPLARLTGSEVLAFDRPGFGLTPRVNHSIGASGTKSDVNPYSMAFSAAAALSFLDLFTASKGVLMGHSAGCFVAVDAYFKDPDRVSALILVAPAIVAPFNRLKSPDEDEIIKRNSQTDQTISGFHKNVWNGLTRLYMVVLSILVHMIKGMKTMIHLIYNRILSAFLRSTYAVFLIRLVMEKFGITMVRKAWFDDSKVTDHIIHNYTSPLKVRGWEMALLEHILSVLTDSISESMRPFNRRLSEISCPVLIVTGDSDRIVPAWNSARLSSVIAGSTLEVIKDCGHLPHEEKPEDFLVVVDKFLRRISTR